MCRTSYKVLHITKGIQMNTETQVEIKKTELALMERINQLLAAMNVMQDNMNQIAKRVVELEKRQK